MEKERQKRVDWVIGDGKGLYLAWSWKEKVHLFSYPNFTWETYQGAYADKPHYEALLGMPLKVIKYIR